jgi:PAS domain S-box-containing protein
MSQDVDEVSDRDWQERESQLRAILDASLDALIGMDETGLVIDWNPSATALFGWSRDEAMGRPLADMVIPERSREAHRMGLARFHRTGEGPFLNRRIEVEARRRDGKELVVELKVTPIRADGRVIFYAFIADITERRRAAERIAESLSLLEATLEATDDGILVVDASGKMTRFNRRFAQMWRIPEAILQTRDDDLALGFVLEQLSDPQEFLSKVRALYAEPEAESFDTLLFKDGRVFERYSHPEWLGSRIVGRVWSFRDVSERNRAEALQSALYRITETTASVENVEQLYPALQAIVGELMDARNFYIAIPDENGGLSFPYFVDEFDAVPPEVKPGKTLTEYVLRTGKPLLASPEVFESLIHAGEVEMVGAPSVDWIGVPLKEGDKTFGVLVVQSYDEAVRYSVRERDLLTFVSQHIASAIDRKYSEQALRASEERFRAMSEASPLGIFLTTGTGECIYVNPALHSICGTSGGELLGRSWAGAIHPDDRESVVRGWFGFVKRDGKGGRTFRVQRPDGHVLWIAVAVVPMQPAEGSRGFLGAVEDVTARRRLEDQLAQAQKLEAVGRLAGGVAHDFNNLLTAIMGYASLLLRRLPADDQNRRNLEEIQKAGERAATLTRQLLTFSRRQVQVPEILDLKGLLTGLGDMLRHLLGEDIELVPVLPASAAWIKADRGQIEQVIVNLAVNARDAMPQGGRLTVQVEAVDLKEDAGLPPGPFVVLTVQDTGTGMDAETRQHIFEPFFTTKERGKGTGLGLATVYGIVQQSGGHVIVESEAGQGATFRIFLPRVKSAGPIPLFQEGGSPAGSETILLVEDEPLVRSMTREILEISGYRVLEADGGEAALRLCDDFAGNIDLMLTDVVMPKMSGRELADRVSSSRPGMRVLYASGYTDEVIAHHGVLEPGTEFIHKPFTPETLSLKVRQVLDRRG